MRGIQGQIQQIIANEKEMSDEKRVNVETELFYEILLKKNVEKSSVEHTTFLDTLLLPMLYESKET